MRSVAGAHADRILSTVENASSAAQSRVFASWRRSLLNHRLEPGESRPPLTLTDAETDEARQRLDRLLAVASDSMDRLFRAVGRSGCCVLLSDATGLVLDRRGTAGDESIFREWGLWPGAIWGEETEGTNGIGTCITEGAPVTIHRDQHFLTRNTDMSCVDAPIYDQRGRLVAVLDVSSCRPDDAESFLGVISAAVVDAARRIENDSFRTAFADARIVMCDQQGATGSVLLAVDRDDLLVGATRAARQIFGLDDASFTHPRPAEDVLRGTRQPGDFRAAERGEIQRALARSGGNVSQAAHLLNIGRATLYRRMQRLGLR